MAIEKVVRYGYTIPYTPNADVPAGTVVDLGTFVGVVVDAIPANTLGAIHCGWDSPTIRMAKYEGVSFTQGEIAYYDAGTETVSKVGYSEGHFGYAAEAAGTGDATVDVKMSPP